LTRIARYRELCEKCNDLLICRSCGNAKLQGTKFSKWLRKQEGLLSSKFCVAHNLDFIWYNYTQDWLITIEEKIKNGKCSESQKQVHNLIRQMLEYASGKEFDVSFGQNKRYANVEYKGHYLIQFENKSPNDSQWIKINGQKCTTEELKILLIFGELK